MDKAGSASRHGDWAKVATFGSGLEAAMARATLEEAGILVQERGPRVGIFGGSFQGPVIGGVDIYVPSSELERARELLQ